MNYITYDIGLLLMHKIIIIIIITTIMFPQVYIIKAEGDQ